MTVENDTVKIFLRLRNESHQNSADQSVESINSDNGEKSYIDFTSSTKKMIVLDKNPYIFDHIFYPEASQQEVFQTMVQPNIERFIEGYNCVLLAYGQSGSGKTFTVGLNLKTDENENGMTMLLMNSLFNRLSARNCSSELSISFMEVYNEKAYDLLSANSQESIYCKGKTFLGSHKIQIRSAEDAQKILVEASKKRHVRSTILNSSSSRSHAIISLILKTASGESETNSVFNICDLAGSEGLRKTLHTGIAQQEGVFINRGLLAVGKVVQALSTGKKLIPYRDSVLTSVLQDSLNTNSFLSLLGCISPNFSDKHETLSTIRFAQSVKALENKNVPEFNAYLSQQQRLKARTPMKGFSFSLNQSECFKTPARPAPYTPGKGLSSVTRHTDTFTINKPSNGFRSNNIKTPAVKPLRTKTSSMSISRTTIDSIPDQTPETSVLNFSTSTEIDAFPSSRQSSIASTSTVPSFSPLIRQIESTIDAKLAGFMQMIKDQTLATPDIRPMLEKSLRLSIMNEHKVEEPNDSVFDVSGCHPTSTVLRKPADREPLDAQKPLRRLSSEFADEANVTSKRVSLRKTRRTTHSADAFNDTQSCTVLQARPTRRSVRISIYKENNPMNQQQKWESMQPLKEPKKRSKISATQRITDMLSANSKTGYKKALLELLNTENCKILQMLPTIGNKTAMQIVTYRALHGSFKTINDLKKVPAMKGKIWEKFLERNMLN